MFDDMLRGLDRIPHRQEIAVQVGLDDDGYFDRTCPAPQCGALFKVLFEDWRDKVPDEQAVCAICGERSDPADFTSEEQHENLSAQAFAHVTRQLDDVFSIANGRTHEIGMLSVTMNYRPGARRVVLPAEASPALTQRSECEVCGCRYASLGAAFFCPACGHNSAPTTFGGALSTVRASMDLADRLPSLMPDRDEAADLARHLAENGLVRIWASFQRFAEATYSGTARRNAFQNLDESERLWREAIGKGYTDFLADEEHRDLVRLVQARHILAHRDGLVDADYVARSGDKRYVVGQRLVVTSREVRRLADIVAALSRALSEVARGADSP